MSKNSCKACSAGDAKAKQFSHTHSRSTFAGKETIFGNIPPCVNYKKKR